MSKIKENYTIFQTVFLLILRFLIGWHIMYEGLAKVLTPGWSSAGYLRNAQWVLDDFFNWIVSEPTVLSVVDFLNVWGLIAIGAGVMFGFLYKFASISGFVLLMFYYVATPPVIGLSYVVPVEGSNLIVNKTLIEAVALLLLVVFPTNKTYGLDYFLYRYFRKNK